MTDGSAESAAVGVRGHPGADSALGHHPEARGGRVRGWWNVLTGAVGAAAGLAPHVLHHIGLLAGTAFIAGAGGTAFSGCSAWPCPCLCCCACGAGSAHGRRR